MSTELSVCFLSLARSLHFVLSLSSQGVAFLNLQNFKTAKTLKLKKDRKEKRAKIYQQTKLQTKARENKKETEGEAGGRGD